MFSAQIFRFVCVCVFTLSTVKQLENTYHYAGACDSRGGGECNWPLKFEQNSGENWTKSKKLCLHLRTIRAKSTPSPLTSDQPPHPTPSRNTTNDSNDWLSSWGGGALKDKNTCTYNVYVVASLKTTLWQPVPIQLLVLTQTDTDIFEKAGPVLSRRCSENVAMVILRRVPKTTEHGLDTTKQKLSTRLTL